jgi:hypothetical protein
MKMYLQKVISRNFFKLDFCCYLEGQWRKSRIRIRIRIWIRIHRSEAMIRGSRSGSTLKCHGSAITVKNPKHATPTLCTLFIFVDLVFVCWISTHNNLGAAALQGQQRGGRPTCQRPFSFTPGVVPELEFSEALGMQLGTVFLFL